jgi:hypothetical protein
LIDQLGEFFRKAFGTEKSLEASLEEEKIAPEEFAHSIEETCRQGLGLSFAVLAGMNPGELEDFCRSGGGAWTSRMSLAAYLLQCDAHLAQRLGNEARAQAAAQQALYFYEQLHGSAAVPAEYRIEEKRGDVIRFLQRISPRV